MTSQDKNMLIESYARGREASLIERYIALGPATLREQLGLTEQEWQVIFDYLVFEHNLLYKTLTQSSDFFTETYIKHGLTHVRDILDVADECYDPAMEVVFDFMAISCEGLQYHVLEHRERYIMAFKARGGDFVRKVLGIWKPKYEQYWEKILKLLLHGVCDSLVAERNFEESLRTFAYLMNGRRQHRAVEKSELLRRGLV